MADTNRDVDERAVAYVDVEVSIIKSKLNLTSDVMKVFQAAYHRLDAHGLTPPMLLNKLAQLPPADRKERIIVRFGLQPGPEHWWVVGNAAFSEATGVVSHQASGFSVDPSFFVEHPHAPFPIEAHPKIMHIPFDHVRYRLLHRFWRLPCCLPAAHRVGLLSFRRHAFRIKSMPCFGVEVKRGIHCGGLCV